jgi:hypothetical protein
MFTIVNKSSGSKVVFISIWDLYDTKQVVYIVKHRCRVDPMVRRARIIDVHLCLRLCSNRCQLMACLDHDLQFDPWQWVQEELEIN